MTVNGKALAGELQRTAQRWPVASAAKVDKFVRSKVQHAAEIQSRRVLAAAHAELCNRALRSFIEKLYEETEGGLLPNLGIDGRIDIPTPWSRTRYGGYGLTDHGGRVLYAIIVGKLDRLQPAWRLLHFQRGRWYLNLESYPRQEAALGWLRRYGITADQWLAANDRLPRRGKGGKTGGRKGG